jgi:excisionase family DNA binding protein
MKAPRTDSLTMTIPEAARALGISKNLAYSLARRGELPGLIRLGEKRMVLSRRQIEKLLDGDGKPKAV